MLMSDVKLRLLKLRHLNQSGGSCGRMEWFLPASAEPRRTPKTGHGGTMKIYLLLVLIGTIIMAAQIQSLRAASKPS
jgi:hypothetical protein